MLSVFSFSDFYKSFNFTYHLFFCVTQNFVSLYHFTPPVVGPRGRVIVSSTIIYFLEKEKKKNKKKQRVKNLFAEAGKMVRYPPTNR